MSATSRTPGLRHAMSAVSASAAILAASAGLVAGTAAARSQPSAQPPSHNEAGLSSWGHGPGGNPFWGPLPGAGESVPGIDTTDPTALAPTPVTVLKNNGNVAPGLIFVAPKIVGSGVTGQQGPEIIDNQGRPFFFLPITLPYQATDFRVQEYRGQPVLTFDVGQAVGGGPGHSAGEDVILNQHYQQIALVKAGNGLAADQHEFRLTPQGTALITIYKPVPYDLSSIGGPANGQVIDGVLQEINIATGKVVFQWDSLDHVPITDSLNPPPTNPATPYDYFHINAVNLDTDGNLLVSGRAVSTIYKINRHTGNIIWRLGGKESTFTLGPGVQFNGQHNALPEAPGVVRIFDNGNGGGPATGRPSRVIDVRVDTRTKTATLVSSVQHPDGLISLSQGNSQRLPFGHLFVGWGSVGRFSEFDATGNLIWDGQVPAGYDTYRAYRDPWIGEPLTDPTVEATRSGNEVTVNAIWNGATQVRRWVVLAGARPGSLRPVASAPWNGLNTQIEVNSSSPYLAVEALDSYGRTIGHSTGIPVSG